MSVILGNPHWSRGFVRDIDRHLQEVETHGLKVLATQKTVMSGPFGVFCHWGWHSKHPEARMASSPSLEPTVETAETVINTQSLAGDEKKTTRYAASKTNLGQDRHSASSTSPVSKFMEPSVCMDIAKFPRAATYLAGFQTFSSNTIASNLDATSRHDAQISVLMTHYLSNVANILQPVLHPCNAYSSIYGNEAKSTAQRMSWGNVLRQSKVSHSKLALVYSLLTSSSFHLRGCDPNRSEDADAMARYFRIKAGSHLRVAIDSLREHSMEVGLPTSRNSSFAKWEGVLRVMLTLVTADVLDGHMSEFWIHLDAAEDLGLRLLDQVQLGSTAEHLINVSSFLRILSDSTDINLPLAPWPSSTRLHLYPSNESFFLGGGHSLEYTYGITPRLADYLYRASLLARNAAYYHEFPRSPPPVGFYTACQQLLQDIITWHISQELLPSFSNTDNITTLLASKHILAFAEGIRIYYHARVNPCDKTTMKSLVQSVASHLTSIEAIKRRTGYNATPTATITWPGFVASCQAGPEDRDIWVTWWHQMLAYRIGNIRVLWSVIQEAWALPAEVHAGRGGLVPLWAIVLHRTGRRILAI